MRVKSVGCAAIGFALMAAAHPAAAQDKPPIVQRAEKCLVAHVDQVVAIEHDLQQATSFLATYACPAEVADVARYERNQLYLKLFSSMASAMSSVPSAPGKPPAISFKVEGHVDPDTGEIVIPPSKPGDPPNPLAAMLPQMSASAAQMVPDAVPPSLKKLAGELVLAALQRLGAKAH